MSTSWPPPLLTRPRLHPHTWAPGLPLSILADPTQRQSTGPPCSTPTPAAGLLASECCGAVQNCHSPCPTQPPVRPLPPLLSPLPLPSAHHLDLPSQRPQRIYTPSPPRLAWLTRSYANVSFPPTRAEGAHPGCRLSGAVSHPHPLVLWLQVSMGNRPG